MGSGFAVVVVVVGVVVVVVDVDWLELGLELGVLCVAAEAFL